MRHSNSNTEGGAQVGVASSSLFNLVEAIKSGCTQLNTVVEMRMDRTVE